MHVSLLVEKVLLVRASLIKNFLSKRLWHMGIGSRLVWFRAIGALACKIILVFPFYIMCVIRMGVNCSWQALRSIVSYKLVGGFAFSLAESHINYGTITI